jgi:proton-translocating NADH-quinone oxidoreductase chain L
VIFSVFLIPFIVFVCLFFFGGLLGFYGAVFSSVFFLTVSFFLSVLYFFLCLYGGFVFLVQVPINFFLVVGGFWEFYFDSLTLTMFFLVSFVSLMVNIYSSQYMETDPHVVRFFSMLLLFTFFMFFLVCASNLIQLFIGWEGVGLCSYLLVNFWFTRTQANKAALKAMLVNRVGDVSLLLLICLLYYIFQTVDFSLLFVLYPNYQFVKIFGLFYLTDFVGFLILLAAMGKSAQLFLHTWLPDAMEGPTPVSSLIHAATMVTAGIFLIIRFSYLLVFSKLTLFLIILIGVLTSFFSGLFAVVQNDIKKIVAYSTCSQLGFMMMSCGLMRFDIAIFHLFNHGFFKALLFLGCGAIIHALGDEQDIRKMGALFYFMPITYLCFVIGNLALVGFPYLSGFFSKEVILTVFFFKKDFYMFFLYIFSLIAVFFTSFYSFRLLFAVFFAGANGFFNVYKKAHEASGSILLVLLLLSFMSIFVGFFFRDIFVGAGSLFFSKSIYFSVFSYYFYSLFDFEFVSFFFKLLPLFFTFFGFFLCFFYMRVIYTYVFMYMGFNKSSFFSDVYLMFYRFLSYKGYYDLLYNRIFVGEVLYFSKNVTYKDLDKSLFEILGASGLSFFYNIFNRFYLFFFNSFLYNYLFFIIFGYILVFFYSVVYVEFCLLFFFLFYVF